MKCLADRPFFAFRSDREHTTVILSRLAPDTSEADLTNLFKDVRPPPPPLFLLKHC